MSRPTWREAALAVREELRAGPDTRTPRGVAILLVLVTLAILSAFTVEFHYKAYVGLHVAANVRDEVAAYYHARSAMEIARLVIKNQNMVDNLLAMLGGGAAAAGGGAPQSGAAAGKLKTELWTIAQDFANGFCTGKLNLMGMNFFDLTGHKGVGVEKGGLCKAAVKPEDGRVSINRVDTLADKQQMFNDLYTMFVKNRAGELKLRDPNEIDKSAAEMALAVIDYADADTVRTDLVGLQVAETGSPEGAEYKGNGKPKDAKYDSLGELQLVPNLDPELYCKAVQELTPYATTKINVNGAGAPVLMSALCDPMVTPNVLESCLLPGLTTWELANGLPPRLPNMQKAVLNFMMCRGIRQVLFSPGFGSVQDFANFFNQIPGGWQPRPMVNAMALEPRLTFKAQPIRIESVGGFYGTYKSLTAVLDSKSGNYVYWREY